MMATMRSNDAFKGLPHDVFTFTMLQEIVARQLGVEPGTYSHFAASLHLYDVDAEKARQLVEEGWQPVTAGMPSMPQGDPWPDLRKVLRAERSLRLHNKSDPVVSNLDPYWADIIRLLEVYAAGTNAKRISSIRKGMWTTVYDRYIERRTSRAKQAKAPSPQPVQEELVYDEPPTYK
jgi:thymidylate synthase